MHGTKLWSSLTEVWFLTAMVSSSSFICFGKIPDCGIYNKLKDNNHSKGTNGPHDYILKEKNISNVLVPTSGYLITHEVILWEIKM